MSRLCNPLRLAYLLMESLSVGHGWIAEEEEIWGFSVSGASGRRMHPSLSHGYKFFLLSDFYRSFLMGFGEWGGRE